MEWNQINWVSAFFLIWFYFFRNKLFKPKRATVWHSSRLYSSMPNYFCIGLISTQFWIHLPLPQVEWFHQNHFVPNVYSWHSWIPAHDCWWGNNPNQERANLCNMLHDPLLWYNCSIHGCFYDCYDISFKVCKQLYYFFGLWVNFHFIFQVLHGMESIKNSIC